MGVIPLLDLSCLSNKQAVDYPLIMLENNIKFKDLKLENLLVLYHGKDKLPLWFLNLFLSQLQLRYSECT
jgi:hypothetical protein